MTLSEAVREAMKTGKAFRRLAVGKRWRWRIDSAGELGAERLPNDRMLTGPWVWVPECCVDADDILADDWEMVD